MSQIDDNANKKAKEFAELLGININDIKKDGKITKKDVQDYYNSLSAVDADEFINSDPEEELEIPQQETPKKVVSEDGKLVCVFNIKEDGRTYFAGEAYTGKNAKYLLGRKSIKEA